MNKWMATPTVLLRSSMATIADAGQLATIGLIDRNTDMNDAYARLAVCGRRGRDCSPVSFPFPCNFKLDPS